MKTKKSLFILLLLPLLLLLHSSFFLLPHNPQAPSLPHHPWQSQNPINFVYFSFAPLTILYIAPTPALAHTMPPGNIFTVDILYLPPT